MNLWGIMTKAGKKVAGGVAAIMYATFLWINVVLE
jgi:hypothetical protein